MRKLPLKKSLKGNIIKFVDENKLKEFNES